MRRFMVVVIAFGSVLAAGVSYAQNNEMPAMPAKVQAMLEKMVGTWSIEGDPTDGVPMKGRSVTKWSPGKQYLVVRNEYQMGDISSYDNATISWDGVSKDGIVLLRMAPVGQYNIVRVKVVSETVCEGTGRGASQGKRLREEVRMVNHGPDKAVWQFTGQTLGGEAQPDWKVVFTRAKTTSDEQELLRLQQEWCRAEVAGDVAAMDLLLADEYVLTFPGGSLMSKAEYLRDVRSEETRSAALTVEDSTVRLYGDMALVKGIVKWTEPSGRKHENLFNETWLHRDGRWQCLATHESEMRPSVIDSTVLGPGMKQLKGLVGNWVYEGEQVDPDVAGVMIGPAGKFSGSVTTRFVLDGAFVESKWHDEFPTQASGINMTGYDTKTKRYLEDSHINDGSRSVGTSTLEGRTLTSDSSMTTGKGETVLVKGVERYSSDWTSYTATLKVSNDGGKTWKLWYTEQGKKLKN